MYRWSPWRKGHFTFAGVVIRQTTNFDIHETQERYCDAIEPVKVDRQRLKDGQAELTDMETTQVRGALMRCQWRATQTAPQHAARIGLAASQVAKPTVDWLREVNGIVKEVKADSKTGLTFYNFNDGRMEKLNWTDMVIGMWADAAHGNRCDGNSTGGMLATMAPPEVLSGKP
eukprot:1899058-Alexandrium_andersonii.AAC.1